MIGVVDVEIQAANPAMPLYPMRAFKGSPSSIRVRNVPKKIGNWQITSVQFTAAYPDNSIKTANCVLVGGVWVGTIAGCDVSGYSENGYSVFASGMDENGNPVNDYCLGKGDIKILEADGAITPNEPTYYVHMLSGEPSNPKDGDMWQTNGTWYVWQNGESWPLGDDSGLIGELSAEISSKADVSSLTAYAQKTDLSVYALQSDLTSKADVSSLTAYALSADVAIELSTKQDKLSELQIQAIDSVVDERATVAYYSDGTSSSFNIVGTLDSSQLTADEKDLLGVKIGTSITQIGHGAFSGRSEFTSVTIPDSVTSIDGEAFIGTGITNITIPDSVSFVGVDAFSSCNELTSVVFEEKKNINVTLPNYPWGITDTSIIHTSNNADQEWVEAQGFAKNFTFVAGTILPFGRKMQLQPYTVTTFSIASLQASFNIVPVGTAGSMREMYLVLTVGAGITQPIAWDASVDIFEGGSASDIAPKAGRTNVYHLVEYASGHFKVSLADNTYSKTQIDQQLASLEPKYKLTTLTANANTISCEANAINTYVPSTASQLSIYMPPQVSGYVRDCILRLDQSQLTSSLSVSFMGGTFETEDGSMPELEVSAVNLISFTETVAGKFDVSHKVVKEIE